MLQRSGKCGASNGKNYSILTNLSHQPDRYQTALLLHSVGPECLRVYSMKFATEADTSVKCSVIIDKFNTHFLGESREFFLDLDLDVYDAGPSWA